MILTKAKLAEELQVSRPRIFQFVTQGMPVRADGRIDLEAACQWIVDWGGNEGPAYANALDWLQLLRFARQRRGAKRAGA